MVTNFANVTVGEEGHKLDHTMEGLLTPNSSAPSTPPQPEKRKPSTRRERSQKTLQPKSRNLRAKDTPKKTLESKKPGFLTLDSHDKMNVVTRPTRYVSEESKKNADKMKRLGGSCLNCQISKQSV